MSLKIVRGLVVGALLAAGLAVSGPARAHDTVIAGEYEIEFGWLAEPPVVGHANAIVLNISAANPGASGSIQLLSPADGAQIQGESVAVAVAFDQVEVSTPGVHWHLYVDDQLTRMFPLEQSRITVDGLSNGAHTLKATLSNASHGDVGTPAVATIRVAGSSGAGEIFVSGAETTADAAHPHSAAVDVDVSGLKVEVIYGPARKSLALQPLGEDTPGQFIARLTPMRAGEYTVRLTGALGGAPVNVDVTPEAVEAASVLQFPEATDNAAGAWGVSEWMALGGLIFGLAGAGLGLAAWLRRK
jgi:hypothetical protein